VAGPRCIGGCAVRWDDYEIDVLLNVDFVNGTFEHHPLFGVARTDTVDFLPLPSPAVYVDTSLAVSELPFTPVTVSTLDVVEVWPLLHVIVPVVGLAGLPAFAKSILQFVAVVDFVLPELLPLVIPPPVQPVIVRTVLTTGLTVLVELKIGSPGVYVCVPWSDLHFGSTVFTALPACPAVSTPTGKTSAIANSKPRPLRMNPPLMDPLSARL